MNYTEYREQRQNEFSALPIFFAFGRQQFREQMEKRGLTEDDTDKIYQLGGTGGFYLRTDADKVRTYFNNPDPLDELMKDYDFAYDAIYCEMGNHEYHINPYQGNWDVCSCFGNVEYNEADDPNEYFEQLGWESQTIRAYRDARRAFLKAADENGWY